MEGGVGKIAACDVRSKILSLRNSIHNRLRRVSPRANITGDRNLHKIIEKFIIYRLKLSSTLVVEGLM